MSQKALNIELGWVELLGDSIEWLPQAVRNEILRDQDPTTWTNPAESRDFLKILSAIREAKLDNALEVIEHAFQYSKHQDTLFLLRARVHFLLEQYDKMETCLQGAVQLGCDPDVFESTVAEFTSLLEGSYSRGPQASGVVDKGGEFSIKSDQSLFPPSEKEEPEDQLGLNNDSEVAPVKERSLRWNPRPMGRAKLQSASNQFANSSQYPISITSFEELLEIKIINLTHRHDRWFGIKSHLEELGFMHLDDYRFEAIGVDGFGELGATRSHLLAMTEYLCKSEKPFLMILEDDFRFKVGTDEFIKTLSWFMDRSQGDVFMMNCSCAMLKSEGLSEGKYAVHRVLSSNSMAGFIVRRAHVRELIGVLLDSLRSHESVGGIYQELKSKGQRESFRPILHMICNDRVWVKLQTSHRYLTLTPSIGSTIESYSDIESRHVDYRHLELQ